MWYDKLVNEAKSPQVINDSKTPSGRVHVGSLRGVLIHDAIFRAMLAKGVEVKFLYGIDDFDPLDGLPADATEELKQCMGMPLCNVPAPPGSSATDMADHYIQEFLGIFPELGVEPQIYRTRDIYRAGGFNEAIDTILSKADVVRQIYAQVSKSQRPSNWHPYQVVCEQCGKIGTTEVTHYDGKEVVYECKPDLVRWAQGCGHQGKCSPFDGKGKLPWKLEWAAKWHTFGVTVEGAGKDHCTKGGSRDVSGKLYNAIFGKTPPLNVPYEFFLVSGAKMSSSKGIGTSAREIADFLPPEILRFLMIRTQPKRTVNFSTDLEYIVKLFNEHDRILDKSKAGKLSAEEAQLLRVLAVDANSSDYRPVNFQLITALLQLPHVDVEAEVLKRMEQGYTELDRKILRRRIASAAYWIEHFAADEEKITLQAQLPESAHQLSAAQRAFLHQLAARLDSVSNDEDDLQRLIFAVARLIPLGQKEAFLALYVVLLDRASGPKGGSLLSYLQHDFLQERLTQLPLSRDELWHEVAISEQALHDWMGKHAPTITGVEVAQAVNILQRSDTPDQQRATGMASFMVTRDDGKTQRLGVILVEIEPNTLEQQALVKELKGRTQKCLDQLAALLPVKFESLDKTNIYQEVI